MTQHPHSAARSSGHEAGIDPPAQHGALRHPADLRRDLQRQRSTATAAALPIIDRRIRTVAAAGVSEGRLVDLGCSWGTLGAYVAGCLGVTEMVGVDRVERRLARARAQGVRTILADLSTDLPLPLGDGTAAIITSFGAIEHLHWFDDFLLEVRRLLVPRGWLLLSMPNLGSYLNRIALLAGYQPRDVEIARTMTPGILPLYRSRKQRMPVGHPHVATLRAMRELLVSVGFEVVAVDGFGPHGSGVHRVLDGVFSRFPSLSRRVLILARRTSGGDR